MENAEEVLSELIRFGASSSSGSLDGDVCLIPPLLEDYLRQVARCGEPLFPWNRLMPLVKCKLDRVIEAYIIENPADKVPSMPNVEPFHFNELRKELHLAIDCLGGTPFTIQRLCELITEPYRFYKRVDKYMRGVEKNVRVVTVLEHFRRRSDAVNGAVNSDSTTANVTSLSNGPGADVNKNGVTLSTSQQQSTLDTQSTVQLPGADSVLEVDSVSAGPPSCLLEVHPAAPTVDCVERTADSVPTESVVTPSKRLQSDTADVEPSPKRVAASDALPPSEDLTSQALLDTAQTTTPGDTSVAQPPLPQSADAAEVIPAGSELMTAGSGVMTAGSEVMIAGSEVMIAGSGVIQACSEVIEAGSDVMIAGSEVMPAGSDVMTAGSGVMTAGSGVMPASLEVITTGSDVMTADSGVMTAGSDVIATGSGVIATGSGVIATGSDVIATGSGVIATGSDVIATGSDVIASGSDVIASGSDVIATGSDVIAAGSDVIASGSGVISAGSDVISAGSDVMTTPSHPPAAMETHASAMVTSDADVSVSEVESSTSAHLQDIAFMTAMDSSITVPPSHDANSLLVPELESAPSGPLVESDLSLSTDASSLPVASDTIPLAELGDISASSDMSLDDSLCGTEPGNCLQADQVDGVTASGSAAENITQIERIAPSQTVMNVLSQATTETFDNDVTASSTVTDITSHSVTKVPSQTVTGTLGSDVSASSTVTETTLHAVTKASSQISTESQSHGEDVITSQSSTEIPSAGNDVTAPQAIMETLPQGNEVSTSQVVTVALPQADEVSSTLSVSDVLSQDEGVIISQTVTDTFSLPVSGTPSETNEEAPSHNEGTVVLQVGELELVPSVVDGVVVDAARTVACVDESLGAPADAAIPVMDARRQEDAMTDSGVTSVDRTDVTPDRTDAPSDGMNAVRDGMDAENQESNDVTKS